METILDHRLTNGAPWRPAQQASLVARLIVENDRLRLEVETLRAENVRLRAVVQHRTYQRN